MNLGLMFLYNPALVYFPKRDSLGADNGWMVYIRCKGMHTFPKAFFSPQFRKIMLF